MGAFRFRKEHRLTRRAQYLALRQAGRRVDTPLFFATFAQGAGPDARLGITVTRKVGGAVVRNRIKRRVREYFRLNRHRLDVPHDINVIAKKRAAGAESREIDRNLARLFAQIGRGPLA